MACSIPKNYAIYDGIDKSGACLFRSIVQAEADANGEGLLPPHVEAERAKFLRKSIVEYVYSAKDERGRYIYNTTWRMYLKSWHSKKTPNFNRKAYADWMSKNKTWGSELQLAVAALLLHRRICVHARGANPGQTLDPIDGTRIPNNRKVLHLSLNNEHYEPYLPINVVRSSNNAFPLSRNLNRAGSSRPSRPSRSSGSSTTFGLKNLYAELDRIAISQLKNGTGSRPNPPARTPRSSANARTNTTSTTATPRRKIRVRRRA
jgi:hypothetical protein